MEPGRRGRGECEGAASASEAPPRPSPGTLLWFWSRWGGERWASLKLSLPGRVLPSPPPCLCWAPALWAVVSGSRGALWEQEPQHYGPADSGLPQCSPGGGPSTCHKPPRSSDPQVPRGHSSLREPCPQPQPWSCCRDMAERRSLSGMRRVSRASGQARGPKAAGADPASPVLSTSSPCPPQDQEKQRPEGPRRGQPGERRPWPSLRPLLAAFLPQGGVGSADAYALPGALLRVRPPTRGQSLPGGGGHSRALARWLPAPKAAARPPPTTRPALTLQKYKFPEQGLGRRLHGAHPAPGPALSLPLLHSRKTADPSPSEHRCDITEPWAGSHRRTAHSCPAWWGGRCSPPALDGRWSRAEAQPPHWPVLRSGPEGADPDAQGVPQEWELPGPLQDWPPGGSRVLPGCQTPVHPGHPGCQTRDSGDCGSSFEGPRVV